MCQFQDEGEAMKLGVWILAAGLALLATTSLAEPAQLAGDELRQAVSGKTVYLNIAGFELPISYAANGRMSGRMSTVAASFSRGDGAQDRGKWWVAGDKLCQQWTSWMDYSRGYVWPLDEYDVYTAGPDGLTYDIVLRDGSTVRWVRNDGRSGTARIGG